MPLSLHPVSLNLETLDVSENSLVKEAQHTTAREIRNLLFVIGSAIGVALLGAAFMLYYYGPTGSYFAKNVLLSPFYTSTLAFNDINPKNGRLEKFVFDGIEFSYFDGIKKQEIHLPVSNETYTQFYNSVASERSIPDITEEVRAQFTNHPSSLSFKVHPEHTPEASKVFLEVNFVKEGEYYRVQLRDATGTTGTWAYFYHPNIYKEAMQLFAKKP